MHIHAWRAQIFPYKRPFQLPFFYVLNWILNVFVPQTERNSSPASNLKPFVLENPRVFKHSTARSMFSVATSLLSSLTSAPFSY